MKKITFTLLLLLATLTMAAGNTLPTPAVNLSQIEKLRNGENPDLVFKGLGLKKYQYFSVEGRLISLAYGKGVSFDEQTNKLTPITDDAFGISFCDAGSGSWDIVFKDEKQLEDYGKDFLKHDYFLITEEWQESVDEDGVKSRELIYIYKDYDEYCDCIHLIYNGSYYRIHIESEPIEYLPFTSLKELPLLRGGHTWDELTLKSRRLKDLSTHIGEHTIVHYGRNCEFNSETFEKTITGLDAIYLDANGISFTNKSLLPLYVQEARNNGYMPLYDDGWKVIEQDGRTVGNELKMYTNQDGIWGGWYGDVITFFIYANYCTIESHGFIPYEPDETTIEPVVTIADLEQLAMGQTTADALRQKIANAGMSEGMSIDEKQLKITLKDKESIYPYVYAYEREARELDYNIDRKKEHKDWDVVFDEDGHWSGSFIILFKGKAELRIAYKNYTDFEVTLELVWQ